MTADDAALRALVLLLALLALGGCANLFERLAAVGEEPELSPIENPVEQPAYQPVSLPMPSQEPEIYPANSLWRQGARSFFKDQRARTVGDVVTVQVTIADEATLATRPAARGRTRTTSRRAPSSASRASSPTCCPTRSTPTTWSSSRASMEHGGRGNTARTEEIRLNIAAVVIQVLPNGNLVIQGRQEVRVNFEVRELYVAGVARPVDITPDNEIRHDQIAELRVAYGGRGQITDVQQPRYGAQVLDVILPY